MKLQPVVTFLLALCVPVASAADRAPLSYTYIDAEYAIDSAIEIYGDVSDSDDAFSIGGSWQASQRFVLWGRYGSAGYTLPGLGEDLSWTLGTVGVLYRLPIREGGDAPLDAVVGLSYESLHTEITTRLGGDSFTDTGLGLRAGLRAGVTPQLDVAASLHFYDYGFFDDNIRSYLDGLFFELGAELAVTPRIGVAATYVTGEIDYRELPGLERPIEVEVDRDEVRLGVRFHFR